MKKYDVIIVGAGPAGIFTALELAEKNMKILLLEKGKIVLKRECPAHIQGCISCKPCSVVSGWGGAGAFSDGKLTLTTEFGGNLDQIIGTQALWEMIEYVDGIYCRFGSQSKVYSGKPEQIRILQQKAARADLQFIPARIRHLGTEHARKIMEQMFKFLESRIEISTSEPVAELLVENGLVKGVVTNKDTAYYADYVVCAPGRDGSQWFTGELERLKLSMAVNPVDLGVRVEVPAAAMEEITDQVYESKLVYYSKSFDDKVRTFCMNPRGEVVVENNSGVITANGHSYADKKSHNTNFALLVSKNFTQPFREPIAYARYIAALANMLGGGVIVQRLGDLLSGRRSTAERIDRGLVRPTLTKATPGDLSLVLPYRYLQSIVEMLEAMDKIAPGVGSRHTLLYGVEVKFYSARPALNKSLETEVKNLFAAGDGAGVTRGLAQASVSGCLIAREIIQRKGGN